MSEEVGQWMVTGPGVERFPKTLAAAKSMVRAGKRRGKVLVIYEQTRNVPGQGPHFYPYQEE